MLYLEDEKGSSYIEYGNYSNQSNCDWIPIAEDFDDSKDYWSFDVLTNTFQVDKSSVGLLVSEYAVMDSGTSLAYFPSNDFDTLV